jgi:hypothetical protein
LSIFSTNPAIYLFKQVDACVREADRLVFVVAGVEGCINCRGEEAEGVFVAYRELVHD